MSATEMLVITVGEPGCLVTWGHVDLEAFTDACKRTHDGWRQLYDDEWDADHDPARHTWMIVTYADDYEESGDIWFREVVAGTPGAEAFTLIACLGYWSGPS